MAILEELKAKANGKADRANNIQEAVSMMEFGGGTGGIFYVGQDWSEELGQNVLDKTWQEIWDALNSGKLVYLRSTEDSETNKYIDVNQCNSVTYSALEPGQEVCMVTFMLGQFDAIYKSDSPNSYPIQSVIGGEIG